VAKHLARVAESLDGVSKCVRLATVTTWLTDECMYSLAKNHVKRFSARQFDLLSDGTRLLTIPEYLLGAKGLSKDIKKDRWASIASRGFCTIWDTCNTVRWLAEEGCSSLAKPCNHLMALSVKVGRVALTFDKFQGCMSILSAVCWITQCKHDFEKGESLSKVLTITVWQVSEVALNILEMLPGTSPLTLAISSTIAASCSLTAFLVDS